MTLSTIQKIDRISTDSDLLHQVVHDDATSVVQTDNGPVPSMSNAINTLKAFNVRGAWQAAMLLSMKDVVTNGGIAYVSVSASMFVSNDIAADIAAGRLVVHQGATVEDLANPSKGPWMLGYKSPPASSIARTVADELNDGYANPKRFGAKGDDSADDSATIQAAIDELAARGGGVVRFPAGNYRCNVLLKDGVTLMSGLEHFGYLPQAGAVLSGVTLSQAVAGFVVDTPLNLARGVCAVKGINFAGLGANYAGGGVRFQNVRWGAIKCCSADNFADQGFLHASGLGVVFEDLLTTNVLLNRVRTAPAGAIQTLGTDDFINRVEANPSLTAVSDANMYICGLYIGGANNFVSNVIGEDADRGIYVAALNGIGHRFVNGRADSNVGIGFYIDGSALFSSCLAYNNSRVDSGMYSGWYLSNTSTGNQLSACRSNGNNAASQQKYGFEDYVNNSSPNVRNSYFGATGAFNAAGLYLTQGYLGSGIVAPPQAIQPADGSTTIDVTGTSLVVLASYVTATSITNFTGGAEGDTIRVLGNALVTIANGAGITTPTGANVQLANKTMYSFTQYNGVWYMG